MSKVTPTQCCLLFYLPGDQLSISFHTDGHMLDTQQQHENLYCALQVHILVQAHHTLHTTLASSGNAHCALQNLFEESHVCCRQESIND